MRKTPIKSSESGIALLLAIFTLLLLAALGLALLSAADLETTIAANYRDKQVSIYSAMSGLQEARDRLIPSRCQTADGNGVCVEDQVAINTLAMEAPASGPTSPYVTYIINPYNSENVTPWRVGSKYFDSELCQERVMSGICSGGAPTGVWYRSNSYLDDSDSDAGEYHTIYKPLSFKWVRVMAKTDNMTPAYAMGVGGGSGYSSIMCWDGSHQVPNTTPPGYKSNCTTDSHSVMLFNGPVICSLPNYPTCTFNQPLGSGYNSNPTITISAPIHGGTRATATVHATQTAADQVSGITVTNQGSNYTSAPTVTISAPPSGTTAIAVATVVPVNGSSVNGFSPVTQTNPIGCYATTPTVSFSGGSGTGVAATAIMTGTTCIAGWTIALTNTCSGGTYSVSSVGGGGGGFQGSVTIKNNGKAISGTPTITSPGSGYAASPTGITGAGTCTFSTQWVLGKQLQSLNLTNGGSGYTTSAPTVTITAPTTPAGAQRPSVTALLGSVSPDAGKVTAITITNPGSGYTSAPTVTLTGGGSGTGATATATLSATYKIDSVTLTNAGSGYTSDDAPTVTISGGGGTGANVFAELAPVTQLGRVYILTALAVAPGGSKTLTQMEVATPPTNPFPTSMPAALTLDAPSVNINPASSNNYIIDGHDANSDGGTAAPTKPAVGVMDPKSVSCITSVLGGAPDPNCPMATGVKSNKYTGLGNSPDVELVSGQLGSLTTVAGADALANAIASRADYTDISPATLLSTNQMKYDSGTPANSTCPTVAINGNLTLTGNGTYCGVLLVTGNLTLQGNYTWYGPIFVIGTGGTFTGGGGGNGQIIGSLFVAETKNSDGTMRSTLGTPTVSFQILGGGGNGIQYDSNWSDRLLQNLSQETSYSPSPLKVLSIRNIY